LSLKQCPKTNDEKEAINNASYASAMGSLKYDMLCTRPDSYFDVGFVSHY